MRQDDLLKPDRLSEIVLLLSGTAVLVGLVLLVVAAVASTSLQ